MYDGYCVAMNEWRQVRCRNDYIFESISFDWQMWNGMFDYEFNAYECRILFFSRICFCSRNGCGKYMTDREINRSVFDMTVTVLNRHLSCFNVADVRYDRWRKDDVTKKYIYLYYLLEWLLIDLTLQWCWVVISDRQSYLLPYWTWLFDCFHTFPYNAFRFMQWFRMPWKSILVMIFRYLIHVYACEIHWYKHRSVH